MDASDDERIRRLLDEYLQMYASRDDRLTERFSEDFSGFTGGGDFLVKSREEWVAITRQDFAQVKEALRIDLKDVAIQSLADTIAVATSFFTIHLPIQDHVLSRETARLVLIFRKESGDWKICHSSISIPYYLVREGEVYPLKELVDRNRVLEEVIAERTTQLSEANENLRRTNEALAKEIAEHKQAEADKAALEAQNWQLQKAESLGRMAGAIAHHFNNQLQVVAGNLEAVVELHPDAQAPPELLSDALRATRRASEVSSLMLTYLGQAPALREHLDLSETCQRNLPLLMSAMPKHVLLKSELPSPGPIIEANARQVQQVLSNLVTNAWEAVSSRQGAIRVTVKTVTVGEIGSKHRFPALWHAQHDTYACLEVSDTGCGVCPSDMDNIFDPFFSTKSTGRGMGLPVVLGVVRAHEGAITVAGEPGGGTTFCVYFALASRDRLARPDTASELPVVRRSGTVLVVDDEEMVGRIAARMVARLGFTVLVARDGVEAVELFRQHAEEIRLVLCDLSMPRMNGWETLTALRQLRPGIPVILASGYAETQVMRGEHADLPQAQLAKPYRHDQLHAAIQAALAERGNDG